MISAAQLLLVGLAAAAGDYERLEREVREQRQLLMQFMQMEEQRYQLLLKLLQTRETGAVPPQALPPLTAPKPLLRTSAPSTAVIAGRVQVKGGSADVYVYVDDVKAAPVQGRTVEIRQQGKEFIPRVTAVPRGTTITFPNQDPLFHNVFSPSPTQPFDLGTYRTGDKYRTVRLLNTGVIEVYCNIHGKMRASLLVVPNTLVTKVAADGTFRLPGVPVGTRRIVAWAADARPALKSVEVAPGGAEVEFTLQLEAARAHDNKFGQPYGSYNE